MPQPAFKPVTYFFPESTIDQCMALIEKAATDARNDVGTRVIVGTAERKRAVAMEAISKMLHGAPVEILKGEYASVYDRETPKAT